jgi:hypothetical protein
VSADEVYRLQTGSDAEARLAQKIFEQGHYAGRVKPSSTRQGTYATAPNGVLLASANVNDPKGMAAMLRRALDKWNSLSPTERMQAGEATDEVLARRPEDWYPKGGLVLRVFSRDLPRDKAAQDWRADAWNQDYAWFTRDEARTMLPAKLAVGEKAEVPPNLLARLVRFNFVDNVRGQVPSFEEKDIQTARLQSEVVQIKDGVATLRLSGETKAKQEGVWSIAGYQDMDSPQTRRRGVSLKLYGTAKVDLKAMAFKGLEVVALGTRFGATQYNGRTDDAEAAPIGFLITQAGSTAAERVAPSFFGEYGWK